ncbi:hypothetical protein AncyloWKF20_09480 [Ancylobacter sp. WKF20]|uniref:hypothetical protein n=1 Tax=Ancylobacter sp. WKF20 TaxID=3039801 RepID=UPI0024345983|nr:hypothetical protein [Ancylobacter sp. WKF20]WGD32023.1 hypothetical protein AncyloWKF20_09480 [Ancylobacter sp. WKF20]
MTFTQKEAEAHFSWIFQSAGSEIARSLFAVEASWPEETPSIVFEDAWDTALRDLRNGIAAVMLANGVTDQKMIAKAQEIAVDSFIDRFTALADAWDAEGGSA